MGMKNGTKMGTRVKIGMGMKNTIKTWTRVPLGRKIRVARDGRVRINMNITAMEVV